MVDTNGDKTAKRPLQAITDAETLRLDPNATRAQLETTEADRRRWTNLRSEVRMRARARPGAHHASSRTRSDSRGVTPRRRRLPPLGRNNTRPERRVPIMVCGSCGRANDADARFCDACGARLDAQPSEAATRKVVTVVFTDVAGSTALGERLDPESLRQVMWRYFDAMQGDARTARRHGREVHRRRDRGRVRRARRFTKTMRFGRCERAFEMRGALGRVNEDLARDYGVRIATRIGVNTGEVIVGDGAADQKLVTGDAVNVAARLEQAAPEGGVLIGQATYRLVRGRRRRRAGASYRGEGQEQAARSVAVCWAWRPDVPAFARSVITPFIGRRRRARRAPSGIRHNGARVVVPTRHGCRAARGSASPVLRASS